MMANSWRKTGKGGERGAPELLSGRSKAGALPRPLCGGFAMFTPQRGATAILDSPSTPVRLSPTSRNPYRLL